MFQFKDFFSQRKVEIFFAVVLTISLLKLSSIINFVVLLMIFAIFHFKDFRWSIFTILIVIFLVSNYTVFIADKNLKRDGSYQYYSISGKLENVDGNVGTVIVGLFEEKREHFTAIFGVKRELFRFKIPLYSSLMEFRDKTVEQLYYGSNRQITLIPAMFYGDKRFISAKDSENFTIAGLNHILAISGQHVGIIMIIIFTFLYRLPFKIKILIGAFFVLMFLPLAGFKIPVLRAGIFVFIIAIAYLFDMKVRMNKLVLWVAALFIIVEPQVIKSPSFVLSFLAVYGISQISREYFWEHEALSSLLVGVFAMIFTTPYILSNFGMVNLLSFLNSILITPFAFVLILLGVISIFSVKLAIPFGILVEKITYSFVAFLADWTDFAFIFKMIPQYAAIFVLAILFLISIFRYKYLLLFGFLILLFPDKTSNFIFFPYLEHSKGYFILGEKSEVYFKGSPYEFRYNFLTEFIKNGGKRLVSFGEVDVGYDTKFVRVKNAGVFTDRVCIDRNGCKIVLISGKNTYRKLEFIDNITYITFSDKIEDKRVIKPTKDGLKFE